MENKPSLKIYLEEMETRYVRKVAVIVNEDTHPELKGMKFEEMKTYIKENISNMNSLTDYYANLEEQVSYGEEDWDKYSPYHSETIIEIATEEDINYYGSTSNHHDDDDEDEAEDDNFLDSDDGDED